MRVLPFDCRGWQFPSAPTSKPGVLHRPAAEHFNDDANFGAAMHDIVPAAGPVEGQRAERARPVAIRCHGRRGRWVRELGELGDGMLRWVGEVAEACAALMAEAAAAVEEGGQADGRGAPPDVAAEAGAAGMTAAELQAEAAKYYELAEAMSAGRKSATVGQAGTTNEEEVKVVFIPIPALEIAEEKRKELRENVKAWNTTHTLKCE